MIDFPYLWYETNLLLKFLLHSVDVFLWLLKNKYNESHAFSAKVYIPWFPHFILVDSQFIDFVVFFSFR